LKRLILSFAYTAVN